MAQKNPNMDETSSLQDTRVSLNFVFCSVIVPTYDLQDHQENTPPPPKHAKAKSNSTVTQLQFPGRPLRLLVPRLPFSLLRYGCSPMDE